MATARTRPLWRRRLAHRFFRFTSGLTRWTERRFTPAGQMALTGLVLLGAFGLDVRHAVTFQALAFAAALVALSLLAVPRLETRLTVERTLPRFATAGEPLRYTLAIANEGDSMVRGVAVAEDVDVPLPTFAELEAAPEPPPTRDRFADASGWTKWITLVRARKSALAVARELPDLPPGARLELTLEAVPAHRGLLHLRGLAVSRPDPLGLARAIRRHPAEASILVLPKRYPLPLLALPGSRRFQQGGVALASSVGEAQEFVELREYRPGDPLRRIHWRSWAKLGKPVVKELEDEFFVRSALVLDTFGPAGPAFEESVSVAASLACAVLTEDSLLDLLFIEDQVHRVTAGRGVGTVDRLLEVLASVGPSTSPDVEELALAVGRRAGELSGCIAVLLDWNEPRRRLVDDLRAAGVPTRVYWVTAAPPADPPEGVTILEVGRVPEGLARKAAP